MTSLSSPRDKLKALRAALASLKVKGMIVPHADEYQSEYLPPSCERLAWLTGFTGSSGTAVVLPDRAAVFTDGRYLIQIARQVDSSLYEIVDITRTGVAEWLAEAGEGGQVIGYDPKLHTVSQIAKLEEKLQERKISLAALEDNPLDRLWQDRVPEPLCPAEIFPEAIAGRSSADKRAALAASLRGKGVAAAVLTLPDSIAWLLNIRGRDIPHNPLVLSYAILYADESARLDWFVDLRKIGPEIRAHLGNAVSLRPHESFAGDLEKLSGPVQVDLDRSSCWVASLLEQAGIEVRDGTDPAIHPKAIKTPAEQAGMQAAHLRDGVAVTRFLCWFDQEVGKGNLSELDAESRLLEFRAAQSGFRMSSFDTIAGWAGHGAIIHYRATPETNSRISGDGLFLLDSGAQYQDGTTDITRTLCVGNPGDLMKDRYTRVLKAHIAVARAVFPEATSGAQVDALARAPLWDAGLDYAHGTGHGVGVYLCVHEESARLSPRGGESIKAGMILSNEPGYYQEGAFGIRLENLVLVRETGELCSDGRKMLSFETLTLVPFDPRLIVPDLLTRVERDWLRAYHEKISAALAPFLTAEERAWLQTKKPPECGGF